MSAAMNPSEIPTVISPPITYAEAAAEIKSRTAPEKMLLDHSLAEVLEMAANRKDEKS